MTVRIKRQDHDVDFCANMRRVAYASCRVAASGVGTGESRIRAVRRAARNCGIDRQSVRDWVHRYNEQAIDGLSDRPHGGGAPAKLTVEEKTQLGGLGPPWSGYC